MIKSSNDFKIIIPGDLSRSPVYSSVYTGLIVINVVSQQTGRSTDSCYIDTDHML